MILLYLFYSVISLYTQFCRIKGCGGAGCPSRPPIIFEILKLPQQIIYRRKGNLSESLNHQKCWENSLISRFYEQFSRSSRILGLVFRRFQICNLFREKFKFRGFTKAFKNFKKYIIAFIFAKFKYFAKQIGIPRSRASK